MKLIFFDLHLRMIRNCKSKVFLLQFCSGGDSRERDEVPPDGDQELADVAAAKEGQRGDQAVRQQQAGRQKEKFQRTTS